MQKKILIPVISLCLISLFLFFFSWHIKFLDIPFRFGVEEFTGLPISFQSIKFRPLNRITIENFTIGESFRCDKATVYFNLFKILKNYKKPEKCITQIHFEKPWINYSSQIQQFIAKIRKNNNQNNSNSITISWKNGSFSTQKLSLLNSKGEVYVDDEFYAKIIGEADNHKINLDINTRKAENNLDILIKCGISGPEKNFTFNVSGINDKNGYNGIINISDVKWNKYSLEASTGTVFYSKNGFKLKINNSACTVNASGSDYNTFNVKSDFWLSALLPSTSGYAVLNFKKNDEHIDGTMNISDINIHGINWGNFIVAFQHNDAKIWTGSGSLCSSGYDFKAVLKNNNKLTLVFGTESNSYGSINGNLLPLDLNINIAGCPLEKFVPLVSFYPDITGKININGQITKNFWQLAVSGTNCKTEDSQPINFKAAIKKDNGIILYNAKSDNDILTLSGQSINNNDWSIKAKIKQFDLNNIIRILKINIPVKGFISGSFLYSSKKIGSLYLKSEKIQIDKQLIDEAKLSINFMPEAIQIKELKILAQKGLLNAGGSIGISKGLNDCLLKISMHKFPVSSNILNGDLNLNGNLKRNGKWEYTGSLEGKKFQFNKLTCNKVRALIYISSQKLVINDLLLHSFLSGKIALDFADKSIRGKIHILSFPADTISQLFSGHIKGTAQIGGTLKNPFVIMNYKMDDAKYKDFKFAHSGAAIYKDRIFSIQKIKFFASKEYSAEADGKLWPEIDITAKINKLPVKIIDSFIKIPSFSQGDISAFIQLKGSTSSINAFAEVSGQNISLNNITINDCKTTFKITDNYQINVDTFIAKVSNSEIRLMPGTWINTKDKKYNLKLNFINMKAGPVDNIIGNLSFSGIWQMTKDKKLVLSSLISTENLWINQYKLDQFAADIKFENSKVTFIPRRDADLQVTGCVDLSALPQVKFQQLCVNTMNQESIKLDGISNPKASNFTLTGKNMSGSLISDILDLPVYIDGKLNFEINADGSLAQPQIESSINIVEGSINDIPYDNINIQLSARQNVLTIIDARLLKKNQYLITASGFMPFYLTKKSKKQLQNNLMDLSLNIVEGSLAILKGVSSDIKDASGELKGQVRFTGTLARPSTNGFIKLTNGEMHLKKYFNRVSKINTYAVWKDNLLTINECSANAGEGKMRIKGTVAWDSFLPQSCNLTFQSEGNKGVPISIPELPIPSPLFKNKDWQLLSTLSHGEPRFMVQLTGNLENPLLSGWIELDNTHFTYPSLVKKSGNENIFTGLIPKMRWNLEIRSGKNSWYDNEMVSANIQGNIKLTGKGVVPIVYGHIEAIRGSITYFGSEFKIKQAQVEIVKDACYIEGAAETEIISSNIADTDTIQLIIDKAEINKIHPRFVSKNNPNLSPEKAMGKVTGIDPEKYSATDISVSVGRSLVRFFDSTLTTPLTKSLLIKTGIIDAMRVGYVSKEAETTTSAATNQTTLPELLKGTKYSFEKYVTDDVLVGYSMTLDTLQTKLDLRHELELSYHLKSNIFLKGTYELQKRDDMRQPDNRIMLEHHFRFGLPKKKNTKKTD